MSIYLHVCQSFSVHVCAWTCVHVHPFMHVCLISDFSVANPGVGVRDSPQHPNGDVFRADITPTGRPLMRSQSFHNAPGK